MAKPHPHFFCCLAKQCTSQIIFVTCYTPALHPAWSQLNSRAPCTNLSTHSHWNKLTGSGPPPVHQTQWGVALCTAATCKPYHEISQYHWKPRRCSVSFSWLTFERTRSLIHNLSWTLPVWTHTELDHKKLTFSPYLVHVFVYDFSY